MKSFLTSSDHGYIVRNYGSVNWLGLWTLYLKEIKRFMSVGIQTIAAPALTSWLFLLVLILALTRGIENLNGVPFAHFLLPGLTMMSIAQNAFANTSSSLTSSKMGGNIIDVLIPPISNREFILAYLLAAVTRGFLVGIVTWGGTLPFIGVFPANIPLALLIAFLASSMMALMGLMTGIWAVKFDQLAIITNFFVAPMTFLSGTFYSISRLPEFLHPFVHANPFFYMIDAFRYAFIGVNDASVVTGIVILVGVNVFLFLATWWMLKTGYRIKT